MPAIYGIVAAAEVERLKPLKGQAAHNEVDSLELAAAEMAAAAAELVATERDIIELRCVAMRDMGVLLWIACLVNGSLFAFYSL